MRHTPWVVSEHVPDFSSLERMLRHPRFAGKQGEALAIAIWGLIVDRELGLFHYGPPMEPFWNKSTQDPLKTFNAFGYSICRCHAHIQAILGRAAGLKSRIANVAGHEGTEFFYDGRWHYFDCDIQMFYRLRPPQAGVIASREDLHRDSSLVTDQPNPSNPYHIPDREPKASARSMRASPSTCRSSRNASTASTSACARARRCGATSIRAGAGTSSTRTSTVSGSSATG